MTIPYFEFRSKFQKLQSNLKGDENDAKRALGAILRELGDPKARESIIAKAYEAAQRPAPLNLAGIQKNLCNGRADEEHAWVLYYWLHLTDGARPELQAVDKILLGDLTFEEEVGQPAIVRSPSDEQARSDAQQGEPLIRGYHPHSLRSSESDLRAAAQYDIGPIIAPSVHGVPCRFLTHPFGFDAEIIIDRLRQEREVVVSIGEEAGTRYFDLNEKYADIAYLIDRQLRYLQSAETRYREKETDLGPMRSQLSMFKTARFEYGGVTAVASALRSRGDKETTTRAKELSRRILAAAPEVMGGLDYGDQLLLAAISDLVETSRARSEPIALVLTGVTAFPTEIFARMRDHLMQAGALGEIELVVAGVCPPGAAHTWPEGRFQIEQGRVQKASATEKSSELDHLLRGQVLTSGDFVALAGIAGVYAECLLDLLSLNDATRRAAHQYLATLFAEGVPISTSTRTSLLSDVSRENIDRLRAATAARPTLTPTDALERLGWATLRCLSGVSKDLECFLVDHIRGDVRILQLMARSCETLTNARHALGTDLASVFGALGEATAAFLATSFRTNAAKTFLTRFFEQHDRLVGDETMSRALYQLAYAHYLADEPGEAAHFVELSLVANGSHFQALNLRGLLRLMAGDRVGARRSFEAAVALDNSYPYLNYNLGVVAEGDKDYATAANAYVRAILADATFYEAVFNLTNILLDQMCFEDAAMVADLGIRLGSVGAVEILGNLSIALLSAGWAQHGLALLKEIHKREPSSTTRFNIAMGQYLTDNPDQTRKWLDLSEDLEPDELVRGRIDELRRMLEADVVIERPKGLDATVTRAAYLGIDLTPLGNATHPMPAQSIHPRIVRIIQNEPRVQPSKSSRKNANRRSSAEARKKRGLAGFEDPIHRNATRTWDWKSGFIRLPSYSGG